MIKQVKSEEVKPVQGEADSCHYRYCYRYCHSCH